MTQDNRSASHKAGYTALLLDPRHRGGLVGVTDDHNLLLLEAARTNAGDPGDAPSTSGGRFDDGSRGTGGGALSASSSAVVTTRRQIVGYNDQVIDIKSFPSGVGISSDAEAGGKGGGESWVAVATNSPQVSKDGVLPTRSYFHTVYRFIYFKYTI